jgi:hypothetical protein
MIQISPEDIKFHGAPETWDPQKCDRLYGLVCERIGYSPDSISEQMHSRIAEIIQKGYAAIELDFFIRTTPIAGWEKSKIEAEAVTIDSKKWANLLKKMESPEVLCCFIITLGKQLDIINEALRKKNLFDPYVLDAFGSLMVEKAADQIEASIRMQLKKNNYEGSRRFSPGYCDWGLKSGQETICRFLTPEKIGVRCLAIGSMVPAKSISAVMVGAKQMPWKSPCRFCKEINCPYRRET